MSSHTLFVYGTLLQPEVQQQIIGRLVVGEADALEGFSRCEIALEEGVFPNIFVDPTGVVAGRCIELSGPELERVDSYETQAYVRDRVRLGSGRMGWVYRGEERRHGMASVRGCGAAV
jgi:gamma-glutamylcyclotransferase (GGCT)/AIG2-like uncharacterized protein YtfP